MSRRRTAPRVLLLDRVANFGITAGGISTIVAVAGIVIFILAEALPLFRPAKAWKVVEVTLPASRPGASLLALGVDEHRESAYAIESGSGAGPSAVFFDPVTGAMQTTASFDSLAGAELTAAARSTRGDALAIGTSDGRALAAAVRYDVAFDAEGRRSVTPSLESDPPVRISPGGSPIVLVARARIEDGSALAAADSEGRLGLAIATVRTNLLGEETRRDTLLDLTPRLPSPATALAFDSEGRRLFAGMQDGGVKLWRIEDGAARDEAVFQAIERRGTPVTCLSLALGDNTLLAGGADGSLQGWFETLDPAEGGGGRAFQRAHVFAPHPAPVVAIEPSRRDRSFLTADAAGHLRLHFATTERVLLERDLPVAARALAFAPKGDGFLAALDRTRAVHFGLDNRHPEISWKALFGKVWYEGYDGPAYAWQSSGGTDDFEGKFSLIPLIFGTVKGTVYALLFAVPIALLGAIYASQFLHHRIRNVLKPAIEIMAAVPSVVLGLIAGLFLAPRLEAALPATILTIAILPLLFLGSAVAWKALPARWTGRFPTGTEILFLIPIALAGAAVGGALGPVLERLLFGGDFHAWLSGTAGVRYDQRNSIVVGFAMGFAVIPILFTICEDSLSAVPQHLVSGSIACGASRWQTALWIVLPAAGSGIFSAIMVGFGRAVGETMIVLMATGNTPILDWSIWNGMRTLSANIAVEIPEAPYHGTLYRVLFLSGLLLFAITFLVNGAAEAIRLRLRRKFGNL